MNELITWSPGVTLEAIEKEVILKAFRFYRGNKTATANALGIAVRTLDNKLEKYEADGQAEKERNDNERKQREQFLARSRGQLTPDFITTGANLSAAPAGQNKENATNGNSPNEGVRVEPAQKPAAQPALSMSERQKVQGVLPGQAAAGHSRGRR